MKKVEYKQPKRFTSKSASNRFFETIDVYIFNAGIQFKTNHFFAYTHVRNILQYVIDGKGTLECNGKTYPLSKYTLFLLPKGCPVKYYADRENPYRYYWISFSGPYADILLSQSGLTPETPTKTVTAPAVKKAFKRIYDCLQQSQSLTETDCSLQPKIQASFFEIFGSLLENKKTRPQGPSNELINHAIDIMNKEYGEQITVFDIAEKLHLSRTYFTKLFKDTVNKSPMEYLSELRFNNACKLLKQTTLSVSDIAESVGLSPNAFFKMFKARMFITPSQYRKQNTQTQKATQ